MPQLEVRFEYRGERLQPCSVDVRKVSGPLQRGNAMISQAQHQLEEDRFNGREALHEAIRNRPATWTATPQEWFLLCLQEIAKVLTGNGLRNVPLEDEIGKAYLRHYGATEAIR